MRTRWILMTVGVVAALSGGCGGEPELAASFDYVVPARFKVPELQLSLLAHRAHVEGPIARY